MKNLYRASQKITIILGVVVVLIIACFLIVQPRIRIDQVESVVLYGYGQEYRTSDPEMIKRISGIIDDAFFSLFRLVICFIRA